MLKPSLRIMCRWSITAAFGRLCVETLALHVSTYARQQPPSGGYVLKLFGLLDMPRYFSAAFGRLCVETMLIPLYRR